MGDTTLRELMYGKGAHVDPVACVEDISVELAARPAADYPHSIWQIVEHMNYWMDYDLSKIAGENRPYPDQADRRLADAPESGHRGSRVLTRGVAGHNSPLHRFAHAAWPARRIRCVANWSEKLQNVGSPKSPRESTVHAMLWQLAAHNSYHAGQIALLRRQFGAWPPERGGDTW